jgi:molybdopterin/thiamine biosynthesis adenylyltransferase
MLRDSEIERYQRHILLHEIGGAGQQKLKAARVLIVGMGGLGHPVAQYLAAAGVGTLALVDDDVVALSNLQRQVLFTDKDIGQPKVEVGAKALRAINPHVDVRPMCKKISQDNAVSLFADYDVVVDASDNFATRFVVNDACFATQTILVSGAVGRFDGQVATFKPWLRDEEGKPLACYRSLVPEAPEIEEDCATTGVLGALTGIIGSLQAVEVIKEITGAGDSLAGRLMIYDALSAKARTVKLAWDPQNPNNGAGRERER